MCFIFVAEIGMTMSWGRRIMEMHVVAASSKLVADLQGKVSTLFLHFIFDARAHCKVVTIGRVIGRV